MRRTNWLRSGVLRRNPSWLLSALMSLGLGFGFGLGAASARADAISNFYQGRTITIVVCTSAGGDYDSRTRLVARTLGKYIPGNPNVVVQNMPGGGGIVAANYVYNVAPQDGTYLGAIQQQTSMAQMFGLKGVNYDIGKFSYIGNTSTSPTVLVAWYKSEVETLGDAQQKQLIVGATGAGSGSVQVPHMLDAILGTKFKVVAGYPGGNEINLAMEKGEVGGRLTQNWAGWKSERPDWVAGGKLNILAQAGQNPSPDLPKTPLISSFARSEEGKAVIDFFFSNDGVGRVIAAGPAVPNDRIAALQKAFISAVSDPMFRADAARQRTQIDAMSGAEVAKRMRRVLATPRSIIDAARRTSDMN